jgi:nucleotidyltransferase substrate binding protein (TIGR01987 family)
VKLDLSSFEKAVAQLETSLKYLGSDLAQNDESLKAQFRGASILTFEYTYELCAKMIKRQMKEILPNPAEVDGMAFMDMMRSAAEAGLVRDAVKFKMYREKRNITSHTYDVEKAEEVIGVLDEFLQDVRFILAELKRRNA